MTEVRAVDVGREGAADFRRRGFAPADVLAAIGVRWGLPGAPSWDRVAEELAAAWGHLATPSGEGE